MQIASESSCHANSKNVLHTPIFGTTFSNPDTQKVATPIHGRNRRPPTTTTHTKTPIYAPCLCRPCPSHTFSLTRVSPALTCFACPCSCLCCPLRSLCGCAHVCGQARAHPQLSVLRSRKHGHHILLQRALRTRNSMHPLPVPSIKDAFGFLRHSTADVLVVQDCLGSGGLYAFPNPQPSSKFSLSSSLTKAPDAA